MSRALIGICSMFLRDMNWYIIKPVSLGAITAQCLKFLQKIFGKILEDFGAKAIITITNPFVILSNPCHVRPCLKYALRNPKWRHHDFRAKYIGVARAFCRRILS